MGAWRHRSGLSPQAHGEKSKGLRKDPGLSPRLPTYKGLVASQEVKQVYRCKMSKIYKSRLRFLIPGFRRESPKGQILSSRQEEESWRLTLETSRYLKARGEGAQNFGVGRVVEQDYCYL